MLIVWQNCHLQQVQQMEHPLKYTDQRQTLRTLSFGLQTFTCYLRTDCTCIDNLCKIRHIRFGFPGPNDSKQHALLSNFPGECVLLAEKICSNRYPIRTSFTDHEQQINRETPQGQTKIQQNYIIKQRSTAKLKAYETIYCYYSLVLLGGGGCCLCVCTILKVPVYKVVIESK